MEITSVNNEIVKETVKLQQKKYRTETNKFLLEGYKAIKGAFDFGIEIEKIFVEKEKKYDKNILKNTKKVVLLENIKDLGNLGTIIRSSLAFGADAIILYGESADIYNPKCVRASVGNLWKLPILHIKDFKEIEENFKNYERIATLPRSNNMLKTFKPKFPTLVMFGSEAEGLSDDLIKFSTESVKIEMSKDVESLNLASSVSVILYNLFVEE